MDDETAMERSVIRLLIDRHLVFSVLTLLMLRPHVNVAMLVDFHVHHVRSFHGEILAKLPYGLAECGSLWAIL